MVSFQWHALQCTTTHSCTPTTSGCGWHHRATKTLCGERAAFQRRNSNLKWEPLRQAGFLGGTLRLGKISKNRFLLTLLLYSNLVLARSKNILRWILWWGKFEVFLLEGAKIFCLHSSFTFTFSNLRWCLHDGQWLRLGLAWGQTRSVLWFGVWPLCI